MMPKRHVIKETKLFDCHQPRAHEGSKRGVLLEAHSLNGMKNVTTFTVRNPNESKNIILQQQCHYREISQSASTPVVYGPQKQVSLRFNFGDDATPWHPSCSCTNDYPYFAEFQFLVPVSRK